MNAEAEIHWSIVRLFIDANDRGMHDLARVYVRSAVRLGMCIRGSEADPSVPRWLRDIDQ